MRHRHGQRKLNITDGAHRRTMMRHLCVALIRHERIKTTLARGKELRRFIEPLVTLGKKPSVHNRRLAFARLQDRNSVSKLFDALGERFASRPGGYVRILKCGYRKGDSAPMALVEFVDKPTAEEMEAQVKIETEAAEVAEGKAKARAAAAQERLAKKAAEKEAAQKQAEPTAAATDDDAGGEDSEAGDTTKESQEEEVTEVSETSTETSADTDSKDTDEKKPE